MEGTLIIAGYDGQRLLGHIIESSHEHIARSYPDEAFIGGYSGRHQRGGQGETGACSGPPQKVPASFSMTATGSGNFFAVDRRAWAIVCGVGMNAAVAYLVLARGTGGDQQTTSGSVNAIESHTGIGRPRPQNALKALASTRALRILKGGSRPRYFLVPPHKIPGAEGSPAAFVLGGAA